MSTFTCILQACSVEFLCSVFLWGRYACNYNSSAGDTDGSSECFFLAVDQDWENGGPTLLSRVTLHNDSAVCVRSTVPSFLSYSIAASSLSALVASIELSLKAGGGTQILSLPSCSCDTVSHCIRVHVKDTCKQWAAAVDNVVLSNINNTMGLQQVGHCSNHDLQLGLFSANTIHMYTGTPQTLFSSLQSDLRNKSKRYIVLSEQLCRQMETDILVRKEAASG